MSEKDQLFKIKKNAQIITNLLFYETYYLKNYKGCGVFSKRWSLLM